MSPWGAPEEELGVELHSLCVIQNEGAGPCWKSWVREARPCGAGTTRRSEGQLPALQSEACTVNSSGHPATI